MTNKEFLLEVQKSCHIEMPRCLMLMGCLQKMLGNAAVDQIAVVLSGLGVFTSHKHPEYVQENPETGIMTLYPPRITYHLQSERSVEGTPCAELLAEYAHVEIDEASSFVDAVVKAVNDHLQRGEEIELPGVGTFKNVVAHHSDLKHIDFLPCDQMKGLVNAPFSCFEAMEIGGSAEAAVVKEEEVPVEEEEAPVAEETAPIIVEEPAPVIDEESAPAVEEEPASVVEEVKEPSVPAVEEPTPAPVEKEEIRPIIIDKGNYIIVKEESNKKNDESTNKVLYISLALILFGCGFLVWLMFGDDITGGQPPIEAVTVENVQKQAAAEPVEPIEKEVPAVEEQKPEEQEAPVKQEKAVEEKVPVKIEPAKPAKSEPAPAAPKAEPAKTESQIREFHRMKDANGQEVKVTLQAGSRLTLIALEHFGDKAFWPYVFEVNSDRLKAPNLVKSGMVLYLPDPKYYGIDANDPESVKKAKNKAAQLLK